MKLLVVTQYFWPENFGINRQIQDLIAQGVEVTVLTGKPNYPNGQIYPGYTAWGTAKEIVGNTKIFRVPLFPRGRGSGLRLALNYLSFVFCSLCFGTWMLRGRNFDAILVYAPSPILQAIPAILLSRIKRAPLAVWVQDLWPQSLVATGHVRNRLVLRLVELLVKWIYRKTDLLLVQSKAFLEPVRQLARSDARVRYFPNSAEPVISTPNAIANRDVSKWVAQMHERFAIVFTGNVGTAQSMQTIVDAAVFCSDVTNICFFVVGAGSLSDWLALEIQKRGLNNLVATGWLSAEAMPVIWDAASALLVTLRDEPIFHRTIPNKLQCYLAAGKPIIACLSGEGARVVEEAGVGFACPAEDGRELANAAKKLAAMTPTERLQLGKSGRKYFSKNFDPETLTTELIAVLTELINNYSSMQAYN